MSDTELELLGWPADGPTLRLDHRRFSYAGKFVMSSTGKAVVRTTDGPAGDDDDTDDASGPETEGPDAHTADYDTDVLAAVAFNEDRTDDSTLWLRYVTVRVDHRGEGLGPRLVRFVTDRARERGYDRVRIAVNNPYSYEALYRAGFGFTGEETGIAELVLERPAEQSPGRYRAGLDVFAGRDDLTDDERDFVVEKRERGPPTAAGRDPDADRHH
ncbi:GNAT family N-acetyltransferase [Haloarchaeobius sp. HRN-SO-5]|uniref:GNAT family N-acetyltransferase n=1 Tax=Haloarchaeobius sp. HRN-SO-5 TaxID=3446118 RepID=UPI003EBF5841